MINAKYPSYIVMSERTADVIESRYRVYYVEYNVYFKHITILLTNLAKIHIIIDKICLLGDKYVISVSTFCNKRIY